MPTPPLGAPAPPLSPVDTGQPPGPAPGPGLLGGAIVTSASLETSDACGTDQDGVYLYPFEGGWYTDANGNTLPANGRLINIVGSTVIHANVGEGYVLPDGTTSHEYSLQFSGMPCTTS